MKEKKRLIKDKARTIIEYLHNCKGHATANEISSETEISYLTVQKYLKELSKKGAIVQVNKGSKQKKYSLNYDKILGVKR